MDFKDAHESIELIARASYKYFLRRVEKVILKNPKFSDLPVSDFLLMVISSMGVCDSNLLKQLAHTCNQASDKKYVTPEELVKLLHDHINLGLSAK